jgi:hypothetical protein
MRKFELQVAYLMKPIYTQTETRSDRRGNWINRLICLQKGYRLTFFRYSYSWHHLIQRMQKCFAVSFRLSLVMGMSNQVL